MYAFMHHIILYQNHVDEFVGAKKPFALPPTGGGGPERKREGWVVGSGERRMRIRCRERERER